MEAAQEPEPRTGPGSAQVDLSMSAISLLPHCTTGISTPLAFLGFGFTEILMVGFIALLVFGGNLPDVMRQLGRTYGKLRSSLNELSAPVREEMRQIRETPPPRRSTASHETTSEDPADIPPLEEETEDDEPRDRPEDVPPITTSKPKEPELDEPPPV